MPSRVRRPQPRAPTDGRPAGASRSRHPRAPTTGDRSTSAAGRVRGRSRRRASARHAVRAAAAGRPRDRRPGRSPSQHRLRSETQTVVWRWLATWRGYPMEDMSQSIVVGVGPLSIADVVAVARHAARVEISAESLAEVARSRSIIEQLADDPIPHYGVSTDFGALATKHIPVESRAQLQRSLVRSHAAGSGPEVEREVVRALMLLRISTLATGRTGIRPKVLETYVGMLNAGITPVVHEYGSLGCSGDLAPLAHCALALMGEGQVRNADGELLPTADAFAAAGLTPVELREKEGLALINGTDGMLGMLCLAITDLTALTKVADLTAAMSIEGLLGTDDVFAADLHELRPQRGQALSAQNLRNILHDSEIRESHRDPAAC